jgi:hypothetical protein
VYCEINERNELIKRRHRLGRTTRTRAAVPPIRLELHPPAKET